MLTSIFIMLHLCPLQKDLVIYEMNVRAFTIDESSGLDSNVRGSYLGLIEKVISVYIIKLNMTEHYMHECKF